VSDIIFLSLSIYAFAIAISALVALMIKGISVVCSWNRKSGQSLSPSDQVRIPTSDQHADEIPIAAISAAVYAVAGPHRIVHIEHGARSPAWVTEGRVRHHSAHNLPRRRH
jgi:hypothetical protein